MRQRENKMMVIRNNVEYELIVPRAGVQFGWQDVLDLWSSLGESARRMACMYTLGYYGGREPLRLAMEGVISRSSSLVDQVVPSGYTATIFQPISVFDPRLVFTPLHVANQIDSLSKREDVVIFRDYSILLLLEFRRDCSFTTLSVSAPYVVDFVPIGARIDIGAIGADMGEKVRFGLEVARTISRLSRR
jgi:hypothetical protein